LPEKAIDPTSSIRSAIKVISMLPNVADQKNNKACVIEKGLGIPSELKPHSTFKVSDKPNPA
jgi:hypothetical protein